MAGFELKHAGAGKYNIMDGDRKVAGPMDKSEAEASVRAFEASAEQAEPEPAKIPAAVQAAAQVSPNAQAGGVVGLIPVTDAKGRTLTEAERRRAYEKRMASDTADSMSTILEPFRALCFALFDPTVAPGIWQQMEPILKAGPNGLRRELRRNMRVISDAPAPIAGRDMAPH